MNRIFSIVLVCVLLLSSCALSRGFSQLSNDYVEFNKLREQRDMEAAARQDEVVEEPEIEEFELDLIETIEEIAMIDSVELSEEAQEPTLEEAIEVIEESIEDVEEMPSEPFLDDSADIIVELESLDKELQKKTVLQSIEDTIKGEGEPKEAIVSGNVLPMWFVYTCAFLMLAILYTLCYLSKQRRWRNRD